MNEVVVAVLALGVLGPAAVTHLARRSQLAEAIAAQRLLPQRRAGGVYAAVVVVLEAAACGLLVVAIWRDDFAAAGIALAALGAAFLVYVTVLRRHEYVGDCGCSAFEAVPTRWSYLPGATLLLAGLLLAFDALPASSAFSAPAGTTESLGAGLLAFTLGFLVWTFPASVFRLDHTR